MELTPVARTGRRSPSPARGSRISPSRVRPGSPSSLLRDVPINELDQRALEGDQDAAKEMQDRTRAMIRRHRETGEGPREMQEAASTTWRRWAASGDTGTGSTRTGVPESTAMIPPRLSHMTHVDALESIRKTGLDPKWRNSGTGLNAASGTAKFTQRDAYLEAVYLGHDEDVGKGMEDPNQKTDGGRVNLEVHAPWEFRLKHMRDARAVIKHDGTSGTGVGRDWDDETPGSTALSFQKIPPEFLHLRDPGTGVRHPLSSVAKEDFARFVPPPPKQEEDGGSDDDELFRAVEPEPTTTPSLLTVPTTALVETNAMQSSLIQSLGSRMLARSDSSSGSDGDGAADGEWE